jgi:hypothetical protein
LVQSAACIFRTGKTYPENGGAVSSKTLITVYKCTYHHIPEDITFTYMSFCSDGRKIK